MKRFSKVFVILFTLVALVSVVAVVASADTSNDVATVTIGESVTSYTKLSQAYTAVNNANGEDTAGITATITLLKDCSADAAFNVTRTVGPVVFDLNGYTLNVSSVKSTYTLKAEYLNGLYIPTNAEGKYDSTLLPEAEQAAANKALGADDGKDIAADIAYRKGAISIESEGVALTVDGNGGKVLNTSINVNSFYVSSAVSASTTMSIKDLTAQTTGSNNQGLGIVYAFGGTVTVDNCYLTTGSGYTSVAVHGGNAVMKFTNSKIENSCGVQFHASVIKLTDTATSDENEITFENCSLYAGGALIKGHQQHGAIQHTNAASGYNCTSTGTHRYTAGIENRRVTVKAGETVPVYVNTNVNFKNCEIETVDYHKDELRSRIAYAVSYHDYVIDGCKIAFAWFGFELSGSGNTLTMTNTEMYLTGFGEISDKSGNADASYGQEPYFINANAAKKAGISLKNSDFIIGNSFGKTPTVFSPSNVKEYEYCYFGSAEDYIFYKTITTIDYEDGPVSVTHTTPISTMNGKDASGKEVMLYGTSTKIDGKITANGTIASARPSIALNKYNHIGSGMLPQGTVKLLDKGDGDNYLCWDPTYVYNPYGVAGGVAANLDFDGDGEIDDGWDLNSDGYPEYIDTDGDGIADKVDLDRDCGKGDGCETDIPSAYTRTYVNQQGFFTEVKNVNLTDASYAVYEFDYSSGEGSSNHMAFSFYVEGRTESGGQSTSGKNIYVKADGTVESTSLKLTPDKWYHFTVIVKFNPASPGESILYLYVDGNYVTQIKTFGSSVAYARGVRWSASAQNITGNAKICIDNSKVTKYTDLDVTRVIDEVVENKQPWSEYTRPTVSDTECTDGDVIASLRNEDVIVSTDVWEKVEGNYYHSTHNTIESALAAAKYGDVINLYGDAENVEITTPVTVNTNGHKFTYYSRTLKAVEDSVEKTVTFTTATPRELTTGEVIVNYEDGTNDNRGILALGSWVVDLPALSKTYNTKDGWYAVGTKVDGVESDRIVISSENIASPIFNCELIKEQAGWMMLESGYTETSGLYAKGDAYSDLANIIHAKDAYLLPNNYTIKFYRDYGKNEISTIVFRHSQYAEGAHFYIDLNGHTLTTAKDRTLVVDPVNAIVVEKDDGTHELYTIKNSGSYSLYPAQGTIIASGDEVEGTIVSESSSLIALHVYTSVPGGTIINTVTGGNSAHTIANYGAASNASFTLTDSNGKTETTTTGISTRVYLGVTGGHLLTIKSSTMLPAPGAFNATVYYNNVYAEAKGYAVSNSNHTAAYYMLGGYIDAQDTTFVATGEGMSLISLNANVESAKFTNCAFISTADTTVPLFANFGARLRNAGVGIVFNGCKFSNVYLAAKTISYGDMKVTSGPSAYVGGDTSKPRLCAILDDNCEFDTEYKLTADNDGSTKVDNLYWVVLDPASYTDAEYKPNGTSYVSPIAPADLYVGALLWNNDFTDPRSGKVYNMTYTTGLKSDAKTVSFTVGSSTTDYKYKVNGTPVFNCDIKGVVYSADYVITPEVTKVTADTAYTATLSYKPTIPVYQNLSLYSSFKYNLYVPVTVGGKDMKDYITSVSLGGVTKTVGEIATIGGVDYYVFTVENIDSNKTAEAIAFEIELTEGDVVARGSKTLSVLGYLETALKGTDAEKKPAEYKLYQATLNYTKAAYAQFGGDPTSVNALWNTYCKDFADDAIDTAAGTGTVNGLNTASLNLVAAPAFRFTAISTTADVFTPKENGHITVSYTYNGKTVTKSTSNGTLVLKNSGEGVDGAYKFYFDIELRAYEFYQDITVTVGETTGTYNLANYYNGLVEQNKLDADLDALLKALNTYARAAAAYKS